MKTSKSTIIREAFSDLRRTWPQLIAADVMAKLLAFAILTPMVGLLLKVFLATTETGVVADEAIVSFLLHPIGLLTLVVITSVSVAIVFLENGVLMVVGLGAVENRQVTWLDAIRYARGRLIDLVHLAGHAVVRLLLLLLPFIAAIGALYLIFLQTYDINYYLTEKPPVFINVIITAGVLALVAALLVTNRIARWVLAVPMVLFKGKGGLEALKASIDATRANHTRLTWWLVLWAVVVVLLFQGVTLLAGFLGELAIPQDKSNLDGLLIGLTVSLLVIGLARFAASVISTILFPLIVVRLFRAMAGPGTLEPQIADEGTLGDRPKVTLPGKPIMAVGALVFAGLVVVALFAFSGFDSGEDVEIIAHRGGDAVAPENTMAAFEQGIADGADWLELDVQEDAEGTVVIAHDRDTMRVGATNLEIYRATAADLAEIDIGSHFAARFADQRVPTLKEVLELAKGRVGVCIELKYYGHDTNLEQKVVELVEATGMVDSTKIISLEYDGLRKMAALRPDWNYGLLNSVAIGDLTKLEVDFLALTAGATPSSMIRHAHKKGMEVYVWTIDDPVQMSVMMSRGADGIITNQVAMARRIKAMRAEMPAIGRLIIWMAAERGLLKGLKNSSARDEA